MKLMTNDDDNKLPESMASRNESIPVLLPDTLKIPSSDTAH